MTFIYNIFCPVCSTSHGNRVDFDHREGVKTHRINPRSFWKSIPRTEREHRYGVIQESIGKGSFMVRGDLTPENEPIEADGKPVFPFVKAHLLAAVGEWVDNGWITRADLQPYCDQAKEESGVGPSSPVHLAATGRAPVAHPDTTTPVYEGGKAYIWKGGKKVAYKEPATGKAKTTGKRAAARKELEETPPPPPKVKKEKAKTAKRGFVESVGTELEKKPAAKKARKATFRGEPLRSTLPDGRYYYKALYGTSADTAVETFIPPGRWKEVPDLADKQPGALAMTQAEYTEYIETQLKPKDAAAKAAFETQQAELKAKKQAEATAYKEKSDREKAVEEAVDITGKIGDPKLSKAASDKLQARLDAIIEKYDLTVADITEEAIGPEPAKPAASPKPPTVVEGEKKEPVFPPTDDNELNDYLFVTWNEDTVSTQRASIASLKRQLKKLLNAVDPRRIDGLEKLNSLISDFDDANKEKDEGNMESAFLEIGATPLGFVEAAEAVEETSGVAPGVLAGVIPAGKDTMTLSDAFKALVENGTIKPGLINVQEARFREILTAELENHEVAGGAGMPGNREENRRLRSGVVTGFIRRL